MFLFEISRKFARIFTRDIESYVVVFFVRWTFEGKKGMNAHNMAVTLLSLHQESFVERRKTIGWIKSIWQTAVAIFSRNRFEKNSFDSIPDVAPIAKRNTTAIKYRFISRNEIIKYKISRVLCF